MFLPSPHGWVHGVSRMGVPARLGADELKRRLFAINQAPGATQSDMR